jgi:hypothetical protein
MTTNSWIGAGLVILVIVFFIVAFFVGGEITGNQFAIVKYLGAFCAALGGGFLILGQAEVKLAGNVGPGTYAISGTGGVALFLIVWVFFPQYQNTHDRVSTFDNVRGSIDQPRRNDILNRSFQCSGSATGVGADSHLWLAVEVGGLIWVKESEIKPDSNNKWEHTVYEDGAPPKFSLTLLVANDDANVAIKAWFRKGQATGQYTELRVIEGTRRLARVDELSIAP